MNRRAFLAGLGATAAGGTALLASGSFSRTGSRRDVTVETVGDEDAYLRLAYENSTVDCADEILLVTLTNQFEEPLTDIDIEFSTDNDEIAFDNLDTPESLAVGESGDVTLDAECSTDEPVTVTVTFDIEASGEENSVTARDRHIDVTCSCAETDILSVTFCGDLYEGDIDFSIDAADNTVTWALDDDFDGTLTRIILYGTFGADGSGPFFVQFDDITGTSGTVSVDQGTGSMAEPGIDQQSTCPCTVEETGVMFEVGGDGTTHLSGDCGGDT